MARFGPCTGFSPDIGEIRDIRAIVVQSPDIGVIRAIVVQSVAILVLSRLVIPIRAWDLRA
jgi:hypothetical protein